MLEKRQLYDDILLPLTPSVLLDLGPRLQVSQDGQGVADLGDLERNARRQRAVFVVRVEKRARAQSVRLVHGAGWELEAIGLEAHPSHGVRWGHGGDRHRDAEQQ